MTELAFRAYNDGSNIVAVVFPAGDQGGSALLRKSVSLQTIELDCVGPPPSQLDMPFGTFSVENRKGLERGGIELVIDYDAERISVIPYSSRGQVIESYAVRYTFESMAVEDARESDIQKAKSQARFRVTADSQPISDETWP